VDTETDDVDGCFACGGEVDEDGYCLGCGQDQGDAEDVMR
jgi:hypothetical protein